MPRGRGVRAERDLAEAAADFYVLELLTARDDAGAARMLAKFEGCLAREFACYLDMAIGGELRYDRDGLPIEIQIVGPRWSEMKLLAIARTLEEAATPPGIPPPPGY